jgi:ketosteroid isomerase-like protein
MLRRTLLIGLASVALAACAQKMTRQERAVEEQVVRDRLTAWDRVLNNKDLDSLAQFYLQSPEVTVAWPDGHRTNGWDEESQSLRDFFGKVASINLVMQDVKVYVLGPTVAITTFRHSADLILYTTEREIFSGLGTLVWVKPDSKSPWVIQAEQLSRSPAPAPAAPAPAPARRR